MQFYSPNKTKKKTPRSVTRMNHQHDDQQTLCTAKGTAQNRQPAAGSPHGAMQRTLPGSRYQHVTNCQNFRITSKKSFKALRHVLSKSTHRDPCADAGTWTSNYKVPCVTRLTQYYFTTCVMPHGHTTPYSGPNECAYPNSCNSSTWLWCGKIGRAHAFRS